MLYPWAQNRHLYRHLPVHLVSVHWTANLSWRPTKSWHFGVNHSSFLQFAHRPLLLQVLPQLRPQLLTLRQHYWKLKIIRNFYKIVSFIIDIMLINHLSSERAWNTGFSDRKNVEKSEWFSTAVLLMLSWDDLEL